MKTFQRIVCLTLVVALASGSAMADEARKGKGKKKGERRAPSVTQRLVSKIELSDEQKAKCKEIDAKFADKFAALNKKRQNILTEEQRATQREMMAKARKDGNKGGGAQGRKAMMEALNLTDDQKAQQKELGKEMQELNKEVVAALKGVLTEGQIAKLPRLGRGAGAKGKNADGERKTGKGKKKKEAA